MRNPEREPVIEHMVDGQGMLRILTPENTVVRTFKNGHECNHFMVKNPDSYEVFFNAPKMSLDHLIDKGFPHYHQDIVDDHTADTFIRFLDIDFDKLLES